MKGVCVHLFFMCFVGIQFSFSVQREFTIFYYPDSVVSSKGFFVDGKPDGFWQNFHPNRVLKSEGKRTNLLLDSIWKFYSPQGHLTAQISYLQGKKNGYYQTYSVNEIDDSIFSVLTAKELYVNNSKEGVSYYYDSTGNLHYQTPFENGKKHGTQFTFDTAGTVIAYSVFHYGQLLKHENINRTDEQGNKTGVWKNFYSNGTVKEESYFEQGKKSGYQKRYNRNGQLLNAQLFAKDSLLADSVTDLAFTEPVEHLVFFANGQPKYRGLFKDSLPIGIHRQYDSAGTVVASTIYSENGIKESEGIFTDGGVKEGFWTFYYPTGQIWKKGLYRKGRAAGEWQFYYPEGTLRETGSFISNKYSGIWTFYYPSGNVLRTLEYIDGLEDGLCTEYNDSSQVIASGMYSAGLKEGVWTVTSGTIVKTCRYRNGEKHGMWKYKYFNGNCRFQGEYRIGYAIGKHQYFYNTGTLEREEIWKSGRPHKIWKFYRPNGSLEMMVFYKRGKERQTVYIDNE